MKIIYYHLSTVDSTNSWAKKHISEFEPNHMYAISALEQTAGRGRLDHKWVSPKEKNIYLTFAFEAFETPTPAFFFSQLASLCLYELVQNSGIRIKIKWPNDLVVGGKKIAGILTETKQINDSLYVIVGLGLNVNMVAEDFREIAKPATSMYMETGRKHPLGHIQGEISIHFLNKLETAKKHGIDSFQKEWLAKASWMISQKASVQVGPDLIEGRISHLGKDGSLILTLDDGTPYSVHSGDLTT